MLKDINNKKFASLVNKRYPVLANSSELQSRIPNVASSPKQAWLEKLGFYFGSSGAHTGRSLMVLDLKRVLSQVSGDAHRADYVRAIVDENILAKNTLNNRRQTAKRMAQLYGLDSDICLFRNFLRLWGHDESAQLVLAATLALARDSLFRLSAMVILEKKPGDLIGSNEVFTSLNASVGGRYSEETMWHVVGNVLSSWTQAGYLEGKAKRIRSRPIVTPANLAFSMFLGFLEGEAGRGLLHSFWAKLLDRPETELVDLATVASQLGLLQFLNASGVMEFRFPGYLLKTEVGL